MSKPLFSNPLRRNTYRVIDGDTVEVLLDRGWNDRKLTSLRLVGLNAPENKNTKDGGLLEKQAGNLVKDLVSLWLKTKVDAGAVLYASSDARPKYAGRTLGRLWADEVGDCLNDWLLGLGVVRAYTGGRRKPWEPAELHDVIALSKRMLTE